MAIAPNDVNVLSVETADLDVREGQNFDVTIEAEAGVALPRDRRRVPRPDDHDGHHQPVPAQLAGHHRQLRDANWLDPGLQTFTFTCPAPRQRAPGRHPGAPGPRDQQRGSALRRLPRRRDRLLVTP